MSTFTVYHRGWQHPAHVPNKVARDKSFRRTVSENKSIPILRAKGYLRYTLYKRRCASLIISTYVI